MGKIGVSGREHARSRFRHVHEEIRDLSLKTMGYAPSAVVGTHLIPR